jgi:hypothetical protein
MSGEFEAVVGRRGRAEIERLASLYGTSGMGLSLGEILLHKVRKDGSFG